MMNVELIDIWFEVVNIKDAKLQGTNHQTGDIDALASRKEFLDQFVLALLQALHAKGHATKTRNLLLGIAESEMAQETFVVLVNLVIDKGLLTSQLGADRMLEALDYLFEDKLIQTSEMLLVV